jgi:hypothetical protein
LLIDYHPLITFVGKQGLQASVLKNKKLDFCCFVALQNYHVVIVVLVL